MNTRSIRLEPGDQPIVVSVKSGCHYRKEHKDFYAHLFIDLINNRLKVKDYQAAGYETFIEYLEYLCRANGLTKIIMTAGESDWQEFFTGGFFLEAIHPGFFRGSNGYHLSKFFSGERRISLVWEEGDEVLKKAGNISPDFKQLPEDFAVRTAVPDDVSQLSGLFSCVFKTYPTPLNQEDYLKELFRKSYLFKAVFHQGKIISAASLDIDYDTLSAELTDCATLPDYRGHGLMSHLVSHLEKEAASLGLMTLYTIARAPSVGINAVFSRFGYRYCGRFVNNCDICGRFEDMNLWSKSL